MRRLARASARRYGCWTGRAHRSRSSATWCSSAPTPTSATARPPAWLDALSRAQEILDPATVLYIGHGTPVGLPTTVLHDQKRYPMMIREVVRRLAGGARMTYVLERDSDALAAELAAR